MDAERIYEKWRAERSHAALSPDFADRVMGRLQPESVSVDAVPPDRQSRWLWRASLCAAAALAAVVRVIELLSVFAATAVGN